MRRTKLVAAATASVLGSAIALTAMSPPVSAAPSSSGSARAGTVSQSDNLSRPWQKKYEERQQKALEQQLRQSAVGKVSARGTTKLGPRSYARTAQSGTDKIFVVLAEFGNTRHSAYCDSTDEEACAYPSDGTPQKYNGPLHNKIPKPDRTVDNSTLWQKDYSRKHYQDIYFNRMANYYKQQSAGKYTVDGTVTEWVKVPFNEARYGRDYCGDIVCNSTWFLIRDALAEWTQAKLDAGWSMQRIQDYLKTFDKQDRYDYDGDGNFNEPDGYIDHFQIVHAGGDEASDDPTYGTDAIWSHKSYAAIHPEGEGPEGGAPFGGVNVGEGGVSDPDGANVTIPDNPTGVWVGNYTIQPENGGLGVFTHEFGHDLGLPDLYDTSGNTGGAENSTAFWSLMSSGANAGRANDPGIGDHPTGLGAWEKFQLGWLDYKVVRAGRNGEVTLRPGQAAGTKGKNGLVVLLPDKSVPLDLGDPCQDCGQRYYYSDAGNELDNTMSREVDGGGELTATVNYDIEPGYDYAFLEVSSDGGDTWESVPTSQSYTGTDDGGHNPDGTGISGSSDGWVDLTATVPDGTDAIRWRYVTDPAEAGSGFRVDNITLGGESIGDAETDGDGWVFDGFRATTGHETRPYLNAYFVDNRQYVRQDKTLKSVYNFGWVGTKRDNQVEHYKYAPGALVTYWDTSYSDNNVGDHPGHGEILPVDANPVMSHYPDGTLARPRITASDATFSRQRSPGYTLHYLGQAYHVQGAPRRAVFNDQKDWWFGNDEHTNGQHVGRYQPGWNSVDVPKTGTTIKVVSVDKNGNMVVKVGTAR